MINANFNKKVTIAILLLQKYGIIPSSTMIIIAL